MDKILRALMCESQVSLTVLETTGLVNEAVKIHKPSPAAAEILGGLLTCGAYLASGLKTEYGCVSLTVKAKDGDGAVSVSVDGALHVRGYADGSCNSALKGGALTVVREEGAFKPYVGACEICGDGVAALLETYFRQSEQIPTAVSFKSDFDEQGNCKFFGGAVVQLLPDASESATVEAGELFEKFATANVNGVDAHKLLADFFRPHIVGGITELYPRYKCNCSEEKIRGVLASVGKAELLKICDELGEVKVHCHYCNKDYTYGKARIEEIF